MLVFSGLQEERKPFPYSEATIITGTIAQGDSSTIYSELGKVCVGVLVEALQSTFCCTIVVQKQDFVMDSDHKYATL